MRRGGILVLVTTSIVIFLALAVGLLYLFRSNFSTNKSVSIESCKLAVDQKFFPSTIREYKLDKLDSNTGQFGALYKSDSSALWLFIGPENFGADNHSEENLENQAILK